MDGHHGGGNREPGYAMVLEKVLVTSASVVALFVDPR